MNWPHLCVEQPLWALSTTCSILPMFLRTCANPTGETSSDTLRPHLFPHPWELYWGLSSLHISSHSNSHLLVAHITAKITGSEQSGKLAKQEIRRTGVGSQVSCVQRLDWLPHVSPGGSSVDHVPHAEPFPTANWPASYLAPLSMCLSCFIIIL